MTQQQEQLATLQEIRSSMDHSSRFISLSGLSGIFAGIFALAGAAAVKWYLYLEQINKAFESRARRGIMSVLMVEYAVDFNTWKETLQLTDGNLASHLRALEEAVYLQVEKQFIGRKPNTRYAATAEGKAAFKHHLDALERLILNNKNL